MQAEFRQLANSNHHPFVSNLTVVNDNLNQWQLQLKNFDEGLAGGRALNADLQRLQQS